MRFPVPQFIGVEDKIAGPLTWKQLYWMIAMGVFLLLLWKAFSLIVFIPLGGLVVSIFTAFAFYKPWGQPLSKMVWHAMIFLFRPKTYTWQQTPTAAKIIGGDIAIPIAPKKEDPKKTLQRIQDYSEVLDNPTKKTFSDSMVTPKSKRDILSIFSKKEK